MKYYLIAGEASGDLHASRLMQELKVQDPDARFRYYGGDAMAAQGGTLVRHYRDLAYMGFYQVVTHLGTILRGMKDCKQDILSYQPDVIILVDYPGFNLGIAKWVKEQSKKSGSLLARTKVVYYISPKIWAWKSYRLKAIRRDVDLLLSILPFEVEWYKRRDYQVQYVGNPTVDELYDLAQKQPARREGVLLVPGSRKAEVTDNLRIMLEATRDMGHRIITGAPGLSPEFYKEILAKARFAEDVEVRFGETHQLMLHARVAAVTSGTATLEAAYLRCPQVVCYNFKGGKLVYRIMQRALKSIGYVSLVNLLIYGISGGKKVDAEGLPYPDERHAAVCELLGPYLTAETLREQLQQLLDDDAPARQEMLRQYAKMADTLGAPGAPVRAAQAILQLF